MKRLLVVALLSFVSIGRVFAQENGSLPQISITGPLQVVYRWSTQRCEMRDEPDMMAHAFRDADGQIQLIDSDGGNSYRMIGPDFNHLKHDCNTIMPEQRDGDPSKFDDEKWLNGTYTLDGKTIFALLHVEYHAWDYPGECPPGVRKGDGPCWYASTNYAVSYDKGQTYHHPLAPQNLIASLPYRYIPGMGGRSGVGMADPTSIIYNENDGYYYFMANSRTEYKDFPAGVCLFRSKVLDEPSSWRTWDGQGFNGRFFNPYAEESSAAIFQPLFPSGKMYAQQITFNTHVGRFLLLGSGHVSNPNGGPLIYAFVYSWSDDLIHWTEPQFLMENDAPEGTQRPYAYPAALDHDSRSRNFSTTGKKFYLYFTRFNRFFNPGAEPMDRDLVRVPVEIQ